MDLSATPLTAVCNTHDGPKTFRLHNFGLWVGSRGVEAASILSTFRNGCTSHSIQDGIRGLNSFASFCLDNDYPVPSDYRSLQDILRHFHEQYHRRELAPSTKHSKWQSFASIVTHLQWKGFFPKCVVPRGFHRDRLTAQRLNQKTNHLGLASANFYAVRNGSLELGDRPAFSQSRLLGISPLSSDEEWLDAYFDDLQQCFDLIRDVAIQEVASAKADFEYGEQLIRTADIKKIVEVYEQTGELVDHDLTPRPSSPSRDIAADPIRLDRILESLVRDKLITRLQAAGFRAVLFENKTASEFGTDRGKTTANGRIVIQTGERFLARAAADKRREAGELLTQITAKKAATRAERKKAAHKLSFFCPEHPQGLQNLLAWADYKAARVAVRARNISSFPGAHHVLAFGNEKVRRLLGLTPEVVVAMHAIIVGETGLNLEVVRSIEVDGNGAISGLSPTDNPDVFVYKGDKRRAGGKQTGIFRTPQNGEINALGCLLLAKDMTAVFRKRCGQRKLWLFCASPKMNPRDFLISDTALKSAWHRFLKRNSTALGSLVQRRPELGHLRVTAGLLDWYNSGGNKEVAARKLGNTVAVAARNYIPVELQDALYRRQIRRFQNLLIISATSENDFTAAALNIGSAEELESVLSDLRDPRLLIEQYVSNKFSSNDTSTERFHGGQRLAFVFSPRNVALLLTFRDYIHRVRLAHPTQFPFDRVVCGCSLREWIDFAGAIEAFGERTLDRGHRVALKRARNLIANGNARFRFPELTDFAYDQTAL